MRILVTGASGFIGSHLISRLAASHEVYALVRNRVDMGDCAAPIQMDLSKPINPGKLPAKIDVVAHLAQANVAFPESANEMLMVNTFAAQQLLDYAWRAGARQFLLASTGDVYGPRSGLCKELDPPAPANYYAVTKSSAEMICRSYDSLHSICVLRLFQPYGPRQTGRLIPRVAERISTGEAIRLQTGDRPHMTPIFIVDVILAIERAIENSYSGTLNIAGDGVVSMRGLAEEIGRAIGRKPVFEEVEVAAGDLAGDNSLMKQALGEWDLVSLETGLARTFRGEEDSV